MSTTKDIKGLEERFDRLHSREEMQEDVVTQFRIDQSGVNSEFKTDIDNVKESIRTLIIAFDKFHWEFTNQTFKIVLWCVSMVLGLLGLIAVVWKVATSN